MTYYTGDISSTWTNVKKLCVLVHVCVLQAEVSLGHHRVHIPSSALRMSRGVVPDEEVQLVMAVIDSKFFQVCRPGTRQF